MTADHERENLPLLPLAIGTSASVFAFSAWGWMARVEIEAGASLTDVLQSQGAGYALAAVLSLASQIGQGLGLAALRRAPGLGLTEKDAALWAIRALVICGAGFSAWSVHNALEMTGLVNSGDLYVKAFAFLISAGVPIFEGSTWYADEALKSAARARRNEADAQALKNAKPPPVSWFDVLRLEPAGVDLLHDIDLLDRLASWSAKLTGHLSGRRRKIRAENAQDGRNAAQRGIAP